MHPSTARRQRARDGQARPAGRPRVAPADKRAKLTLTILPAVRAWLDATAAERGCSVSALVEGLVTQATAEPREKR